MNQYTSYNTSNYAKMIPSKHLSCDVIIVGTGAGGGVTAEILSEAGLNVYLIEEGPLQTSNDFTLMEKQAYRDLYQESAARQTKNKSVQILQGRCVGGSTTVNWTSSFRTPEKTLNHWRDYYSIKGLSKKNLTPYFQWVEKRLHIQKWHSPPNKNNALLAEGAHHLGWSFSTIARNVKGCANLGYCGMGCPLNAKQSMLVSCIPQALSQGAHLITHARAESLIVEKNEVKGIWLSSMNENGQVNKYNVTEIRGKMVVLSAGAIGTPSILLRTKKANPHIHSDPYRQVGKRTFLHPVTASIAKMKERVNAYEGAPQSIYSDQFLWRDGVSGALGYKMEVSPMHPVLTATLFSDFGETHQKKMKDFAYYQSALALMRDGFNEECRGGEVFLDDYLYPHLDYSIHPKLFDGFRHALVSMAQLQFAAGAERVYPLHLDATEGYSRFKEAKKGILSLSSDKIRWKIMSAHVMGGASLGDDPKKSVVNSQGEHHHLDNLMVIDASLFPTSLGVNPQLTIYALAAKLSEALANRLKPSFQTKIKVDNKSRTS
jgi:choline dehydrogenase-like flavoprotein